MKKIIYLNVLLLVILSCSKSSDDDIELNLPNSIKISKQIITENGVSETANYTYNGDKIVSIITESGSSKVEFTYNGNFIQKKIEYKSGVLSNWYNYYYQNEKVISIREGGMSGVYQYYIKHLNGENITYQKLYCNSVTGAPELLLEEGVYVYLNENLISFQSEPRVTFLDPVSVTYTYDTKINFTKNILNYNKIIGNIYASKNNPLTITSSNGDFSANYSYTYNSLNYPVTEMRTESKDGSIKTYSFENFY